MRLTWLSHAAFLLEGRNKILIDPFLTGNPKAPCSTDEIQCDIICITHGHGDHLGDAISISKRTKAPIVAIHEIARYAEIKGCEAMGMNMGGSINLLGTKITMVQGWHSSGIDESHCGFSGGSCAGFIINTQKTIYHAGDTCIFSDMKLIGEFYKPEIALLPIGDRFTMNPEHAARACAWIKPDTVIPMHYNTFPPVEQDPDEFKSLVESLCDSEVVICDPGKTIEV
jgi:L-ascorbate metabolism protein UlaG (beta-lactamase superfamily)